MALRSPSENVPLDVHVFRVDETAAAGLRSPAALNVRQSFPGNQCSRNLGRASHSSRTIRASTGEHLPGEPRRFVQNCVRDAALGRPAVVAPDAIDALHGGCRVRKASTSCGARESRTALRCSGARLEAIAHPRAPGRASRSALLSIHLKTDVVRVEPLEDVGDTAHDLRIASWCRRRLAAVRS